MALADIFKKQDNTQTLEHFWSLVLGKGWIESGIWRVVDEKTEVIAQGGTTSWQEGNIESLIAAADSSLSSAAASLEGDAQEPSKVVFGLPPSWIEEGSIKKERLDVLKKLSQELELTPAGFVVIPEAIVHFLKVSQGAPPNAILVGLSEDSIDVTLVYNGKLSGTIEVARSMSLGADVAEGLARLPQSLVQYPSRLLLYNHKAGNLDEARQSLIEVEWKDLKVPFLHTPKVEVLPEDVSVSAVSLAGGAEVGHAKAVVLPEDDMAEEEAVGTEEPVVDEVSSKELLEVSPEDLGFVRDSDVALGDVNSEKEETKPQEEIEHGEPQIESDLPMPSAQDSKHSFLPKVNVPSFSFDGGFRRLLAIIGIFLGILLIAGTLAYWYVPKAKVVIYIAPKILEKNIEFSVDQNLEVVDNANKVVPGNIIEVQVSGDKTSATSGTKTVGERAKGQVTVTHVGGTTTLKSGTVLTGPNNLKFTLDGDVPIASGAGVLNPSQKAASVTAADIGAQYNLVSGTEFSVGNFSKDSFGARNETALSGGTSRSVSAVGKEDRENLEKELLAELLEKGTNEAKGKKGENDILVDGSAAFNTDKEEFSHKVGEEAGSLKLTLSGTVSLLVLPKEGINSLILSELERDVPSDFSLRQDQIEVSYERVIETKTTKDGKKEDIAEPSNKFIAKVRANLLPKVNSEEIALAIAGKQTSLAEEYLATLPGYVRSSVNFNIRLPGKLGTLPRISRNISVEVAAEK